MKKTNNPKQIYRYRYKDTLEKICNILYDEPLSEIGSLDKIINTVEKLLEDNSELSKSHKKCMKLLNRVKPVVGDKANFYEIYKDERYTVWKMLENDIEEHLIKYE
jgi:hypothetical protein